MLVNRNFMIGILAAIVSMLQVYAAPTPSPFEILLKRGATVYQNCERPNTIALSFDDGPYYYMKDIVNTLKNAGAKGTFFVNGDNWSCIYDDQMIDNLRYAYDAGHMIGSHTWAHRDLQTLDWDQAFDEFSRVELALQRIIGAQPAFVRPPYGSYNQMILDVAEIRGQQVALWDFDSGDATGSPAWESNQKYDEIAYERPSNLLALNHETYASSAYDVLPHALSVLQGKGYEFVTVAECLGQNPYQWVGSKQDKNDDWHC